MAVRKKFQINYASFGRDRTNFSHKSSFVNNLPILNSHNDRFPVTEHGANFSYNVESSPRISETKLLQCVSEPDTVCNGDAPSDNSLAVERSIGKFYKLLIYCLLGVRQCME